MVGIEHPLLPNHATRSCFEYLCPRYITTMLSRWSRAISQVSRAGGLNNIIEFKTYVLADSCRKYAHVATATEPTTFNYLERTAANGAKVNLDMMFWSKPCSLALASDSPLRMEDPKYEGIRFYMLKLLLFYSKQSKSIRGANVVYSRIISQVDKPAIYNEEGKEGVEFGQYLYEIYNHDLELRVSKAGVNLLLTKWMKDLEKIFYGNVVAYDTAMLPEARKDDLPNVLWRNVFSDDGSSDHNGAATHVLQAMARYVRRESSCLALTDSRAMFTGNFMFTPLENVHPKPANL